MSDNTTVLVKYDVDEAALALVREKCATLTCDTPAGYEEVRVAIGNLRTTRTKIEKRRVELKADALAYGRLVDTEAKRVTALVTEIESPLQAKKDAIDNEAARLKAEEDAAKLKAIQDEIDANNAAKEAEAKAIRDAEEARIAAERAALAVERAAMEAERAKAEAARKAEQDRIDAEQRQVAEAQRVEREALEATRREIEQALQAADRAEFERQAKMQAEKDAAERVERERVEKLRRDAELAAMLPDLEKVKAFAAEIRALAAPQVKSKKVADVLTIAINDLLVLADAMERNATLVKQGRSVL
jgi:chromosome segregation ATPase